MKHLLFIMALLTSGFSWTQIDRTKAPKPQPNPKVNIPKPVEIKLENGLKVIMVENHNLPKISYQLFIDNPPKLEHEKVGMADLFGELLGGGTKNTPKDEFNQSIDFMGATFSSNSKGFYASSLTKHSDKLLSLLKDVVMQPLLDKDEFERIKTQTLSGLEANKADPSSMSSNVSNVINYGENHPYGEVVSEQTLANITIDDMSKYYSLFFRPNHAYLVIVGDIDPTKMKDIVENAFGEWKRGQTPPETADFSVEKTKNNQVTFVNKRGAVQSVIKITNTLNLKPNSEDAIKLSVLNSILGGGSFSARLMSNLREDKAYTYGCYSSISPDMLVGEFSAGGSFRNAVTDSAVVEILAEINRISKEEITDAELDIVIKSKTGAFARSLENPQTVARFALNTARYNLPADYYTNYLKNLEAVTKSDVLAVAKKYLQASNTNIVIVGNEEIAEKLERFDSDGSIDFRDGLGEKAIKLLQVDKDINAEGIISNYLTKIYMTDDKSMMAKKNKSTQFIMTEYAGNLPEMGMAFDVKMANSSPNKSAVVMKANGMVMQQEYFNGTAGKSISMQGEKELTAKEIEAKSTANFPFDQVHYFKESAYIITLLGIDRKKDGSYYKIEVKNAISKNTTYEYYNVESGLLEMTESITELEDGKVSEVTVQLSDYKAYGKGKKAMLFSQKQVVNNNGMLIEMTLNNVTLAKKAPSNTFSGGLK
ncbi:MAG: M16 family metallopeptidase [Crocinitomicaceae bacterium]